MERKTIENILNFLYEKEGKKLPNMWVRFLKEEKLIQELENHPDGTQYRYDGRLDLDNTNITKLPKDLYVGNSLFLSNCEQLTELPDKLHVGGALYLSGCEQLIKLPDNLSVVQLYLNKCKKLTELPNNLYVKGKLYLINSSIMDIPNNLYVGDGLFIKNTPLASNYTDEEIYEIVTSKGGEIIGEINR
jgi:hypothetical protein